MVFNHNYFGISGDKSIFAALLLRAGYLGKIIGLDIKLIGISGIKTSY